MSEKVKVELGGKSKYEVAKDMAELIFALEGRANLSGIKREEYLRAVHQSLVVLEGGWPF